jgi:DNA ligase (NAD+)
VVRATMPDRQKSEQERINHLAKEILRHRDLYYNTQPEISDAEYDLLEEELSSLDPENPILFQIGEDSSEIFTKRAHIIPMMSQGKVYTAEDFNAWARKRNYKVFIIQFKLDGISIELQYKNGLFQYAVTRGDGEKGDDITANVVKMKGFKPKLSVEFTGGIRAEIVLFHEVYKAKYSNMANCRNAGAGIARRKDGKGCEDLNLIHYDTLSLDGNVVFNNEIYKIKWLKEQGFPTVLTKTVHNPKEVIEVWENVIDNIIDTLEYDIDGLVIKGKEIDLSDMKRVNPIKQTAFKFRPEGMEATLIDVNWSISGHNYTPVGKLEEVHFSDGTVENPSLANPDKIKRLGIKIPCKVIVTKNIVPDIVEVLEVPPDAVDVEIPKICEVCNTPIINTGGRVYCPNEVCHKRHFHRLVKWIEKQGILHFGEKSLLQPLYNAGKIKFIADFYKLTIHDLTQLDRIGEKSARKALDNLFAVKEVSLAKFIGGFDIEGVGEDLVQRLVDEGFDTLEKLKNSSIFDLSKVEGFGNLNSKYLLDGIEKLYPQMQDVLNTNKVSIKSEEVKKTGGKLEGISFCITGSLENFKPRSKAEELVINLGGIVKGSVTKDLNYLVTNSNEPTTKYKAAQSQDNTEIINEEEFMKMVE